MKSDFLERIKNVKGLWFIIVGLFAGIILLILGTISSPKVDTTNSKTNDDVIIQSYTNELELKIKNLVGSVEGVSNVNVMLTLDSGSEYVYAKNNSGKENDISCDYVIINESSNTEKPILVKEINPKIRGVAIVCNGGESAITQSQIITMISTIFNVSSNRICVVAGK